MAGNDEQIVFDSIVNIVTQGADDALDVTGRLDKQLSGLEGSYNIDLSLNLSNRNILSDLDGLNSTTYVPEIDPTLQDSSINSLLDLDSTVVTPEVDVQSTADSKSLLEQISLLQTSGIIDLTMNVGGAGISVIEKAYGLLTANEEAVALFEARTAESIPNAAAIIDDVLTGSLADSREEIAKTLALADQLDIPDDYLDDAAKGAFDFARIFDEDVAGALTAADQLVDTGVAKSYAEAFDLIQTGFEEGLNKGGDFLDVIREYSTTFADLGLSGPQALNAINSGLENGFDNADRVADALREFNIRASNPDETAAQDSLKQLGLGDEAAAFQAGEITGGEFFRGVLDALSKESDAGVQQQLAANIFGTQAEDFGLETLFSIDPVNAFFDQIEGRAATARDEFNNTLGASVTEFFERVEVEASEFLNSDQLGLREKLDTLKDQLSDTLGELESGATLPEAIEVGFNIPGFAESVDRFEAGVGNFLISVLELIAGVQDFTGNAEGAADTRLEISRLAERQLAFDLKVANPDEIAGEVTTALGRGVDVDDISEAAGKAVEELIADGDIGKAQELLDILREIQIAQVDIRSQTTIGTPVIASEQVAVPTGATQEDITAAGYAATGRNLVGTYAEVEVKPVLDTGALQESIDMAQAEYRTSLEDAEAVAREFAARSGDLDLFGDSAAIRETTGAVGDMIGTLNDLFTLSGNQQDSGRAIGDAATATGTAVTDATNAIVTNTDTAAIAVEDMDSRVTSALTGNTVTASFDMTALSAEMNFARVSAAILPVIANIDELDVVTASNIGAAILQLDLFGAAANRNRPMVEFFFTTAKRQVLSLPETFPILTLFTSQLNQIGTAAGKIAAATGQAAPKGYAAGGIADGLFLAGEDGPELISTDTSLAVLNNRSSTALVGAAQSLFAGLEGIQAGNTVNNSNREFMVIQNFYTGSEAESMSAAQQAADAMRGFN